MSSGRARSNANLRPWKPGQSGNPGGHHKLPEDLRAIRALHAEELCRIISKYGRMSLDEITACRGPHLAVFDAIIIRILEEALKNGDTTKMAFLMDRAIGKVREAEILDPASQALKDIEALSDRDLMKLANVVMPEEAKGEP